MTQLTPTRLSPPRALLGALIATTLLATGGCGGGGTEPVRKTLEALPVTAATVHAAVEFVTKSPSVVPPTCSGTVIINCPGGTPGANVSVAIARSNLTVTEVPVSLPRMFNFSVDLAITSLQDIPAIVQGLSCGVAISTANGPSPTVHVTGSATFPTNPTTGITDRVVLSPTVTGIEEADLTLNGGLSCSLASGFKGLMIGSLTDAISRSTTGALCGAPGPALLFVCPEGS